MADLKTTIAQTENLKNKVKLAKDRINETVVRGGVQSTSVAEVPKNITKMLGNYKKIAMGSCSKTFTLNNANLQTYSIPININFKPSRVIVHFRKLKLVPETSYSDYIIRELSVDSEFNYKKDYSTLGGFSGRGAYIDEFDETEIKFGLSRGAANETIYAQGFDWIAIE